MNRILLPDAVARALADLERAGYPAYVVGGCVRDGLRQLAPHDWDVCTAARPEQTRAALSGAFLVLDTGLRHGTVTAVRDHLHIEITTYRTEGGYSDGRRPDEVTFVDRIEDDLARRDFTVGAIAYSPVRGFCDPFGGEADLAAGLLRCVGDADARFSEDALRILRGLRLSAEHGFAIDGETARAMERQRERLDRIAAERIYSELTRLLCGRYAGRVLRAHKALIGYVLPELRPMFGLPQQNAHHRFDVWEHTVCAVEQVPNDPVLRWAMLLHDSGKPECKTVDSDGVGHFRGHPKISREKARQITTRLKFSGEMQREVLLLVEQHDLPLGDNQKLTRRRLAQIGEARFRALLAIKKGDVLGQRTRPRDVFALCATEQRLEEVLRQQQCFSLHNLAVDGRDMMALGLHGPEIGQTLHKLLQHVIEYPHDNQKSTLLTLARRIQTEELTCLTPRT